MHAATRNALLLVLGAALVFPLSGSASAKRSPADQRLYEKARKECRGPRYSNGARIVINYKRGWFRCEEFKTGVDYGRG